MNTEEKLMMTVVATAVILLLGFSILSVYTVNHLEETDNTAKEDPYILAHLDLLEAKGGTIYCSGGHLDVLTTDTVAVHDDTVVITRGTSHSYVVRLCDIEYIAV